MIAVYYGKIGDGKTYHVVSSEILKFVKQKRKLYTNIDSLDERQISTIAGIQLSEYSVEVITDNKEIVRLMTVEVGDREGKTLKIDRGSAVIIDEAQMVWDARDFKNTSKEFLTLLEYHRHFGLDFVFITQNPARIEKSIRLLANYIYFVRNKEFMGSAFAKKYRVEMRSGFEPNALVISENSYTYEEKYFRCYRSAVMHSERRKIPLPKVFYFLIIPFLLLAYAAKDFFSGRGFLSSELLNKKTKSSITAPAVAVPLTLPENSSSYQPVDRVEKSRPRSKSKQCGGYMIYEGIKDCLDTERYTCEPCTQAERIALRKEADLSTLSTGLSTAKRRSQFRSASETPSANAEQQFDSPPITPSPTTNKKKQAEGGGSGDGSAFRRAVPRPGFF